MATADTNADKSTYSEPAYASALDVDKAKYPFYRTDIAGKVVSETKDLLERYSDVPRERQVEHVGRVRDLAWQIRAYPCTGLGAFLVPQLRLLPIYPYLLKLLKSSPSSPSPQSKTTISSTSPSSTSIPSPALLDVGCFIGHDLRRLVYDSDGGIDSARLWGLDIVSHWDVGFEMFRDRKTWKGGFVEGDFLDVVNAGGDGIQPSKEKGDGEDHGIRKGGGVEGKKMKVGDLKSKMDVVCCSQVLHQWDWDGQVRAAKALVEFLRPLDAAESDGKEEPSERYIVGNQIGNRKAQAVDLKMTPVPLWRHNAESMKRLWEQVGSETGTRWEVQAWLKSFEEMGWSEEDARWMEDGVCVVEFVVRRVGSIGEERSWYKE